MTDALPVAACGWSGVARPTWLAASVVAGQGGALAVLPTEHVEPPDVIKHVQQTDPLPNKITSSRDS